MDQVTPETEIAAIGEILATLNRLPIDSWPRILRYVAAWVETNAAREQARLDKLRADGLA